MTLTTIPRRLGPTRECDAPKGKDVALTEGTPRLADLIREEEERLAASDPARELSKRRCPSGE